MGTLLVAVAFAAVAVLGLGAALFRLEFSKTARRRRNLRSALARAERQRAAARAGAAPGALTAMEALRLEAWRARAHAESGRGVPPGPLGRVRAAWQRGYGGWVVATLVGSFGMATHFGAYWLITGGGWVGASVVTLGSTLAMGVFSLWIVVGMVESSSPPGR